MVNPLNTAAPTDSVPSHPSFAQPNAVTEHDLPRAPVGILGPPSKHGKPASAGVAFGKALVLRSESFDLSRRDVRPIEPEIFRFESALATAKSELARIRELTRIRLGDEKAAIFDAHIAILEDPEMTGRTLDMIKGQKVCAEYAFSQVTEQFVKLFESMDNDYMRERIVDIRDVSNRFYRVLAGRPTKDLSELSGEVVVIADELAPSQIATMHRPCILGILTNVGGRTSHTAIMARALEIPAIVGLGNITESVQDGQLVALDGNLGQIWINPDEEALRVFRRKKTEADLAKTELKQMVGQASVTQDGRTVHLEANIGTTADLAGVLKYDAEGVGLFRTEFLYMNRAGLPTEDEQFEVYKKVLESMPGRPVIIRTLDIGGDKQVPALKIAAEMNPFLGYRAIRYCLNERAIFKTQLRAMLRASAAATIPAEMGGVGPGELKIMFPMITTIEELRAAKAVLEEVSSELASAGTVTQKIPVGMMIEVPAAAIMATHFAKEVDFFSIGTNDLIQYVCAVDRTNEKVSDLHDAFQPAVLTLLDQVIRAADKAGIPVGMCGEMAGTPELVPVLVGMGLSEFSMSPAQILSIRRQVRGLKYETCRALAREVLTFATADEVRSHLIAAAGALAAEAPVSA